VWNGPAPASGDSSQGDSSQKEGSLDLTDTRFTPHWLDASMRGSSNRASYPTARKLAGTELILNFKVAAHA
jgi:hypothetical protein